MKYRYGFSGNYYVFRRDSLAPKLLKKHGFSELLYIDLDPDTGECIVYGKHGRRVLKVKMRLPSNVVGRIVSLNAADPVIELL